ncbi:MAG: glycosyltransferase family 4 protein [Thermoplasmatota archaeon]
MKVAFAARNMPPKVIGGLERFSDDVLAGLRRDFEVTEVANRRGRRWTAPYLATAKPRLVGAIRAGAQVVDASDASLAPALAGLKAPTQVRVHGLDLLHPHPIYQKVVRRYLPKVDVIVANSEATRGLLADFGITEERTRVVNPAADAPAGHRPDPQPGRILFLGRLVERKGVLPLVERVWPHLADHPEVYLDIVGDGPLREEVEEAVDLAPSNDRITLHGALPQGPLEQLFARADCFVMPNRATPGDWEGFGIVAAEAAARGVPVVAHAVDGMDDAIIHGATGLKVPGPDDRALAAAILKVVDRRELGDRAAIAAEAASRWSAARLHRDYAALTRETAALAL